MGETWRGLWAHRALSAPRHSALHPWLCGAVFPLGPKRSFALRLCPPPDLTPIHSCSSTSRRRGTVRPICTPQLPSSHARALDFLHTGEVQGSVPCASTTSISKLTT